MPAAKRARTFGISCVNFPGVPNCAKFSTRILRSRFVPAEVLKSARSAPWPTLRAAIKVFERHISCLRCQRTGELLDRKGANGGPGHTCSFHARIHQNLYGCIEASFGHRRRLVSGSPRTTSDIAEGRVNSPTTMIDAHEARLRFPEVDETDCETIRLIARESTHVACVLVDDLLAT